MIVKARSIWRSTLPLVLACLLSFGVFSLSYHYDNKYTTHSPQAMGGVLFLNQGELDQHLVIYLINGWELYQNRLLTPQDYAAEHPSPDRYTAIGQYSGFESEKHADPHGSATYRLNLILPEEKATYALELPEIYSAYRLYLNDTLLVSSGNPEPDGYTPQTKTGSISFQAAGSTVLTFTVSDFSHLYSGMVYPPAFGKPDAVASALDTRFAFSLLICSIALLVGLFYLCLAFPFKNRRFLLFALLCLCLIGSVGYPVLHRLFRLEIQPWYAFEIAAGYAVYLLFVLLINSLCGVSKKISLSCVMVGGLFCVAAFVASMTAPLLSAQVMHGFSLCTSVYKLLCSAWMLSVAAVGVFRSRVYSPGLLAASGVFACALLADRLFPLFEPIFFGWFTELAGIFMLAVLGCILLVDTISAQRRQLALEQDRRQMAMRLQMQKEHYRDLAVQIEQVRSARHDLRHHLTTLQLYLQEGRNRQAQEYLDRLNRRPELSSELSFCEDYNLDVLLRYYASVGNSEQIQTAFQVQLPAVVEIPSEDICIMLGNLLENAVEACRKVPQQNRFLYATIFYRHSNLMVEIQNSYKGRLVPMHGLFASTKRRHSGMGLKSVQAMAEKYHGNLELHLDEKEQKFVARLLLVNRVPT